MEELNRRRIMGGQGHGYRCIMLLLLLQLLLLLLLLLMLMLLLQRRRLQQSSAWRLGLRSQSGRCRSRALMPARRNIEPRRVVTAFIAAAAAAVQLTCAQQQRMSEQSGHWHSRTRARSHPT